MASIIQVLPPSVAERIAAGEVIERPSSVVKELVENSLDAGATEVLVLLEDGGKNLIEVLDNGRGMSAVDIALALKRHATSKLKTLADLESIRSLGFRGEALPSIAAVSDFSILSREIESSDTHQVKVGEEPTRVTFGHFNGSPHGTRIQARGLFSQVPARLKFLKSKGSEVSQVREWMERLALAYPQVGFKLVSDDRTVLTLRPETEVERVRSILSDGDDFPVVSVESDQTYQGFSLRLHWLQGLSVPQTRKLVQVVNHRALRDRLLQQAMLNSFKQLLLPGQFPALALFLEINPAEIDVNVHPTKTEIRFLDTRKIFHAIDSLVQSMVNKHGAPAYATSSQNTSWPNSGEIPAPEFNRTVSSHGSSHGSGLALWQVREEAPVTQEYSIPKEHPLSYAQYVGILFQTYLMYDLGEELALVDQHAAHERIRFEQLKSRVLTRHDRSSQALLIPEAARFPSEMRETVESRLPLLAELGFQAEIFGEDTVLFRGVPPEWGMGDLAPRLKNLVERLTSAEISPNLLLDETVFEKLASEACRSSVRAGDRLDPIQAAALVQSLFQCEHPWNCPHGRPTVARVPRARLEEWFQRRV